LQVVKLQQLCFPFVNLVQYTDAAKLAGAATGSAAGAAMATAANKATMNVVNCMFACDG
jgi:hypothetical protein